METVRDNSPRVVGISRMFDNKQALLLSLDKEPTNDEMRAMHDLLNGRLSAAESGDLTERLKWLSAALSVRDLHKEIATVEEAIIALSAGRKDAWMPIETAPKNHFAVLAYGQYGELVAFQDVTWTWWPSPPHQRLDYIPTHWQPLPAAPDSGQAGKV